MKTAIYIEDGTVQLVITPETDFEKTALTNIGNKTLTAKIFQGTFYDCRGGWVRQSDHYPNSMRWTGQYKDESIIIRVDERKKEEQQS